MKRRDFLYFLAGLSTYSTGSLLLGHSRLVHADSPGFKRLITIYFPMGSLMESWQGISAYNNNGIWVKSGRQDAALGPLNNFDTIIPRNFYRQKKYDSPGAHSHAPALYSGHPMGGTTVENADGTKSFINRGVPLPGQSPNNGRSLDLIVADHFASSLTYKTPIHSLQLGYRVKAVAYYACMSFKDKNNYMFPERSTKSLYQRISSSFAEGLPQELSGVLAQIASIDEQIEALQRVLQNPAAAVEELRALAESELNKANALSYDKNNYQRVLAYKQSGRSLYDVVNSQYRKISQQYGGAEKERFDEVSSQVLGTVAGIDRDISSYVALHQDKDRRRARHLEQYQQYLQQANDLPTATEAQAQIGTLEQEREALLQEKENLERAIDGMNNISSPNFDATDLSLGASQDINNHKKHIESFQKLIAQAFKANRTRVASIMYDIEQTHIDNGKHHAITHGDYTPSDFLVYHNHYMRLIGHLLAQLQNNGVLEDTLVVACSGMDNACRHEGDNLPIVLAGTGGGLQWNREINNQIGSSQSINVLFKDILKKFAISQSQFGTDGTGNSGL